MKRLLDIDPLTKTKTYHHYDHDTKITRIEQVQDVQNILEQCKRFANDPDYKRKGIKEDYYHFARVPNSILVELLQKYHLDWRKKEDLPKIEQVLTRDYKKLLTVDKI